MKLFFQNIAKIFTKASLILAISTSALCNESSDTHTQHNESLSPHVHGKAELHLVLDNNQLLVELHSPAMNLLGFEHEIHNSEDQAVVENARAQLENPSVLFLFKDGECVPKQQSADFSDILAANEHEHANHESHENHEPDNNSHNDIKATYLYVCEKPDSLNAAQILLLDVFPNITSLQVQWIIRNQQGASTLSHDHNEINFQ